MLFSSDEWNALDDDQKEEIGLSFDHDGEFWWVRVKANLECPAHETLKPLKC